MNRAVKVHIKPENRPHFAVDRRGRRFGWLLHWPLGREVARSSVTYASEAGAMDAIGRLIARVQLRQAVVCPDTYEIDMCATRNERTREMPF